MSSMVRRAVGALVVLLALLAQSIVTGSAAQAATSSLSQYEQSIVDMTNASRGDARLTPLAVRPGLTDVARRWATTMATTPVGLSHNPSLGDQLENNGATGWTVAAENVGTGGSAASVYDAYMKSAPHRANLLRSTVDSIGVGAVRTEDGRVWDVMVFSDGYSTGYNGANTTPMQIQANGEPGEGATADLPVALSLAPGSPRGNVDGVEVTGPGQISVRGWALDPDTADSTRVHVYVGSRGTSIAAADPRGDIDRAFPGYGGKHGFSTTISGLGSGRFPVCSYAINTGTGGNVRLGCTTVDLGGPPIGVLDGATVSGSSLSLRGWALDPDTAAAVRVHVYVDGVGSSHPSGSTRGDIGRAYPGYGDDHGFSITRPIAAGRHQVCVYAINAAGAGPNKLLKCVSVTR